MAMQEFHDGTFGEPKPIDEVFGNLLKDENELLKTKALHIGKISDLIEMKKKEAVIPPKTAGPAVTREEFDQLRKDVNAIMIQLGLADRDRVLVVDQSANEKSLGMKY